MYTHRARVFLLNKPLPTNDDNKHGKATNISGMDVSPSRVVLCSADTAWYYHVPHASDTPQQQHLHERRQHQSESQSQQWRIQPSRDEAITAGIREGRLDFAGSTLEAPSEAAAAAVAAVSPDSTLRGVRLPSSCVTEARFSGDEERCFFGSMSGEVYVVSQSFRVASSLAGKDS